MRDARELEKELVIELRQLPVSIQVHIPDEGQPGLYSWQCLEGKGRAINFAGAMSGALNYMIGRLVSDLSTLDDLQSNRDN